MSINDLPEEIFRKIFSNLLWFEVRDSATLVCKTWLRIIRNDSRISKKEELRKSNISRQEIREFVRKRPKLETIIFHGKTVPFFKSDFEECPTLQNVVFANEVDHRKHWRIGRFAFLGEHFSVPIKECEEVFSFEDGFPLILTINKLTVLGKDFEKIKSKEFQKKMDLLQTIKTENIAINRNNEKMRSEFRRILQVILSKAQKITKIETSFWAESLVEITHQNSQMKVISLACQRRKTGDSVLKHLLNFPNLEELKLKTLLNLKIPINGQWKQLKELWLEDCGFQDWKLIPKAFPQIEEIWICYGGFYKTLRKHVRGLLELVSCLHEMKRLEAFKWEVALTDEDEPFGRESRIWIKTLREKGHEILSHLQKLRSRVQVNIELKNCIIGGIYDIITFVKEEDKKPFMIKHRKRNLFNSHKYDHEDDRFDIIRVCQGEQQDCGCDESFFELSDSDSDIESEEEEYSGYGY